MSPQHLQTTISKPPRVISMRLIVTACAVALIASAVIGAGSVAEQNTRRHLSRELATRLVLDARNLAVLSSSALLSEYPELTLHPTARDLKAERPDLVFVYVIDHNNIVQGHTDLDEIGTPYALDMKLTPVKSDAALQEGESLVGDAKTLVLQTPVRHLGGKVIGHVVVGVDRGQIEATLAQARRQQLILLLPILGGAIIITLLLMSRLLRPIGVLRRGLERIGHGDFDTRLEISARTEFGLLARSVNEMVEALKTAQKNLVEKERLDREMELARAIQQSLLPKESLVLDDYVVAGAQTSADEVGGDYYDFFPLDDTRYGLVIADVSGKGLGGCLVMSMTAALIRTLCRTASSPKQLLIALEDSLAPSLQPGTFVTMFYGILETRTGELAFASAGHGPLLHYGSAANSATAYGTKGTPLGLVPGALAQTVDEHTLTLAPGDVLLQFTDGFNEAINTTGDEYGFDRVVELFTASAARGCDAVIGSLCGSLDEWEGGNRTDDKTLLLVQRVAELSLEEPNDPDVSSFLSAPKPERVIGLWRQRKENYLHFTIPATLAGLDYIGKALPRHKHPNATRDDLDFLEQGLYEVCANIAEHGCDFDAAKNIDVWWLSGAADDPPSSGAADNYGYLLIRDNGRGPNLAKWEIPDLDSDVVRKQGRGLGLRMIQAIMRNVEVHASTAVGNLTIMKFRKQPAEVSPR